MNTLLQVISLLLLNFFIHSCGETAQETVPEPDQVQNPDGIFEPGVPASILVFTKTAGFRHTSIEKGVATLKAMEADNDFKITHTEDARAFSPDNLKQYSLVIFLSTTEDVLDEAQQQAFKTYIEEGGNFMGIHSATDTEYEWEWYGKLVGAYFKSHPEQQQANLKVVDKQHPATAHLPETWSLYDEWYNFRDINPEIQVLIELDESSYSGGENGNFHPIAWYHEFGGGRNFYTGLGHTEEIFDKEAFRKHLLGGINYCLGRD